MKTRRWLWLSLMIALVCSIAIACSNDKAADNDQAKDKPSQNNQNQSQDNGNSNNQSEDKKGAPEKYDPPVSISVVYQIDTGATFKNGETIEDNVTTRWAKDELGIDINYLWMTPSTNNAFKTKLMLTLSANEPLPDILSVHRDLSHDLIESRKFIPVGDLFEQYASDTWKNAMAQVPDAWLPYMRDGEAYGIPLIDYLYLNNKAMWIRKDWLEKFDLKAPTTIEELEHVMDVFVNQDPDENGLDDTYGLALSLKDTVNGWVDAGFLFGAYGSVPMIWQFNDAGEIVYGSTQPQVKQALGKYKEWLDKGYLHQEIALHDPGKASELFTSGKAGIIVAASWAYSWPLNGTVQNVPDAEVWPYPLPAGPNGDIGQAGTGSHANVMLINKDMKNPEAIFTYMNYLYDHYENPAAGSKHEHGFAQGYDYDIVDGEVTRDTNIVEGGIVNVNKYWITTPPRTPLLWAETLAGLAEGKTPETPFENIWNLKSPAQEKEAAKVIYHQREHIVENVFTGQPTETMQDVLSVLNRMEEEAFNEIIYGKRPLDDFDKFVDEWNKAGGAEITKEVREWYNAANQ